MLADTHLRIAGRLPERCAELIAKADAVIHAGDLITEVAFTEIAALGKPVHAVHGNVDDAVLRSKLPAELELDVGGARVAVVHDAGPRNGRLRRMRARFPHAGAVIFGHSHMPEHVEEDGFQIFNPGSPTQRRRAARHTMGLMRVRRSAVSFELVEL